VSNEFNETLRWPTNLDRAAIEKRLAKAYQSATDAGLTTLAFVLKDIEGKRAADIAKAVMNALNLLEGKPEHRALTLQLEMVALNLKNLK
jgi:hypothetical protein